MDTTEVQTFVLSTTWKSHKCTTIQEYLQEAYGKPDRAGHGHAFRGASKHYPNLRPSIDRRDIAPAKRVQVETDLLAEFFLRAWDDLTPQERHRYSLSEARWGQQRNTAALMVARHRLVPTRCVDWTDCPLRSLFFACDGNAECDGEVWWFNRNEFDFFVAAQWPALFHKQGHVEADLEQDFIAGSDSPWFTGLKYMLLPDDRPHRQKAWITVAGRPGTCHAEEIHRIGVSQKGRLVIPPELKLEAVKLLAQLGITKELLGLGHGDPADEVAAKIKSEFEETYPRR